MRVLNKRYTMMVVAETKGPVPDTISWGNADFRGLLHTALRRTLRPQSTGPGKMMSSSRRPWRSTILSRGGQHGNYHRHLRPWRLRRMCLRTPSHEQRYGDDRTIIRRIETQTVLNTIHAYMRSEERSFRIKGITPRQPNDHCGYHQRQHLHPHGSFQRQVRPRPLARGRHKGVHKCDASGARWMGTSFSKK